MDELKCKLEKYLQNARKAFETVKAVGPGGEKIRDSAIRYYSDALHFYDLAEYVNAFAALEYAEGWLDAGIATGQVTAENKSREQI